MKTKQTTKQKNKKHPRNKRIDEVLWRRKLCIKRKQVPDDSIISIPHNKTTFHKSREDFNEIFDCDTKTSLKTCYFYFEDILWVPMFHTIVENMAVTL